MRAARTPSRLLENASPNVRLIIRACSAYFRAGGVAAGRLMEFSAVQEHSGRRYVIVRDEAEILAIYRVRPYDQVLRRLKRTLDPSSQKVTRLCGY